MPSLRDLKNRIASVKSTRKITAAMKMVAASKLRRAQEQAEAARPYAARMSDMLSSLASSHIVSDASPRLLAGTGRNEKVLLLVVTSNRGLCGGFNGSVVREARKQIRQMESEGKRVKLFCVGRKGRDLLRRDNADKIAHVVEDVSRQGVSFEMAESIAAKMLEMFEGGQFDVAKVIYNRFRSAISQVVTVQQMIPVDVSPSASAAQSASASQDFEPDEESILDRLLPRNISVQVFSSLLESSAGEHGARMTAMDNATRNAGDMINRLTLNYNRSRQAYITKELIEIISGAEAV